MSNFFELTQTNRDKLQEYVLFNRYHVSTISKSNYSGKTIIRMNNGATFEVEESYDDVKDVIRGDMNACR